MKKLMMLSGVLLVSTTLFAAPRTVLLEILTNTGCTYCPAANAVMDQILDAHPENVLGVRYHVNWPAPNDPFYLANPDDNNARRSFYGVNAVPDGAVDGYHYQNYNQWSTLVNNSLEEESPLLMELEASLSGDQGNLHVMIEVEEALTSGQIYLLTGITEDNVLYGGVIKNQALRDFFPTSIGTHLDLDEMGSVIELDLPFQVEPDWDLTHLNVFAFVQDLSSHDVHQSGWTNIPMNTPFLTGAGHAIVADDNGDGRPDPGETVDMTVDITNDPRYLNASDVEVNLSTNDPDITITTAALAFPDCAPGATVTGGPFTFAVSDMLLPHKVMFHLEMTADTFSVVFRDSFEVVTGRPHLLLVDDDSEDFETDYQSSLAALGVRYDDFDINVADLSIDELSLYDVVIWETGRDTQTLYAGEMELLTAYLNQGGNLLFSSQYAEEIAETGFMTDMLRVEHLTDNVSNVFMDGVAGDPIGDGLSILASGYSGGNDCESPSEIAPLTGSEAVFMYRNTDQVAAVRYDDGDYRTVFFAFPVEAISGLGGTSSREAVLASTLNWLGLEVEFVNSELAQPLSFGVLEAWPNPFNPAVNLHWQLRQPARAALRIFDLNGAEVAGTGPMEFSAVGEYTWNATDQASGVYLVLLEAGDQVLDRQMVTLLK